MSQPEMAATGLPTQRRVLFWYDPMHPAYTSDQPGIAPDCGMNLVPKYADEVEAMQDRPPGTVMLSTEKQQLIGVRTTEVRRAPLQRTIRTVGRVEADETKIAHIHVKVPGWVEKVYVDFVGKLVKKGQPLFTFYSPDLVSTQQEYLIARRGEKELGKSSYQDVARGAESLLRAARDRLRLWDISDEQIQQLEETGQVTRTMTIYSPINGFVTHRNLYEQAYVKPDTQLYMLADLSTIWVYADIYEYEVPYVRVGQRATMQLSYFPGKSYAGRVSYIYPTLDSKTRTVRVRLDFRNPGFALKPGMFADVELKINYGTQTLIPSEAVLDSGLRQIVFIAKPGGFFEPREVQLGARLENQYIVLSGVEPGETIVTSGNFLIDSESRLSTAAGGISHQH
ncbi:MAG: efflux RND transporter periplasmic adaptor subunit [Acidobacteria bacterium]|nr:efflux RND transporter periplasmic adaptor subunit [Acidobacteriota bacterium]